MSSDLVWQCIRNNSSFLRKRAHLKPLNAEPDNLMGTNSFKFSSLANTKSLGVRIEKKGKKESVVLSTKTTKKFSPKRSQTLLTLSKNEKKGLAALDKEIRVKGYRRDLAHAAKVKYIKLRNSFKKAKEQRKPRRHRK